MQLVQIWRASAKHALHFTELHQAQVLLSLGLPVSWLRRSWTSECFTGGVGDPILRLDRVCAASDAQQTPLDGARRRFLGVTWNMQSISTETGWMTLLVVRQY